MTSELELFRELLYRLWRSHPRPWDSHVGAYTEVYRKIGLTYQAFGNDRDLEAFLPAAGRVTDFAYTRRYVYLQPCQGPPTLVPVLSVRCDSTLIEPEVRLQLALFLLYDDHIKSIGLRFESPEGGGPGVHDYYHGQLITGFQNGPSLLGAPPWLPITQPAMTLNADGPVGLLLSLLVGLYGAQYVAQTILVDLPHELHSYAKEFVPDYWLVRGRDGQMKYRTFKSEDRFRKGMDGQHVAFTISTIDHARYEDDDGIARTVF